MSEVVSEKMYLTDVKYLFVKCKKSNHSRDMQGKIKSELHKNNNF